MPQGKNKPSLYGITEINSSRSDADLWGKNQFNSTFPLSLCIYLRDKRINPVSVLMAGGVIATNDSAWEMGEVVGKAENSPYYEFEKVFNPYAKFSRNEVDSIDLVVSIDGRQAIPLEIKLTVVPDSGTSKKPETEWAPEMVMRPVSSSHAMMGVADSLLKTENKHLKDDVVDTLKSAYNKISSWDNEAEILKHSGTIYRALLDALEIVEPVQKPFLLQPVWKTKGQSLELCDQCFDVFVWSDVSIMGVPAKEYKQTSTMTRAFREISRHVRSLYDLLLTGDYDYSNIYKGMSHGNQTDKSYAIGGRASINYLRHDRLVSPILPKTELYNIILNGGETQLRPERRFDAAVQSQMIRRSEEIAGYE